MDNRATLLLQSQAVAAPLDIDLLPRWKTETVFWPIYFDGPHLTFHFILTFYQSQALNANYLLAHR